MSDNQITVSQKTYVKWMRYQTAQNAKSRWSAEEKEAKADLLTALGYKLNDEKPQPAEIVDSLDNPIGEVRVSERRVLDTKYLREKYPDVYAECERVTHPVSIKAWEPM